jgi:hypothetical protein
VSQSVEVGIIVQLVIRFSEPPFRDGELLDNLNFIVRLLTLVRKRRLHHRVYWVGLTEQILTRALRYWVSLGVQQHSVASTLSCPRNSVRRDSVGLSEIRSREPRLRKHPFVLVAAGSESSLSSSVNHIIHRAVDPANSYWQLAILFTAMRFAIKSVV